MSYTENSSDTDIEIRRLRDELAVANLAIREGQVALDRQAERAARAEQALESFKTSIRERMIEEADRRDWCWEFDQILIEFGMEPRHWDHDVTLTIEVEVTVSKSEVNSESAVNAAIEELPISEGGSFEYGETHFYVTSISGYANRSV